MMSSTFKIVVGGENLIDFVEILSSEGPPQYSANPGGSPFNLAIASARQGCDVDYITPLSDDRLGKLIANRLNESGVKMKGPVLDAPTSLAVVSLDGGQPGYQIYRNGTAERLITQDQLDAILQDNLWLFHIGSLALSGGVDAALWEEFFITCHQKGVITSLDPNVRPMFIEDRLAYINRLERMFNYADIIKLSDEDIKWLYPEMEMAAAFDHLVSISSKGLRVLTKGADGARACSDLARIDAPAHPVEKLVDTVGAGDTFMATMLAWLVDEQISDQQTIATLSADDLEAMMTRAAKAAAMNCEKQGCNPPTREAVLS